MDASERLWYAAAFGNRKEVSRETATSGLEKPAVFANCSRIFPNGPQGFGDSLAAQRFTACCDNQGRAWTSSPGGGSRNSERDVSFSLAINARGPYYETPLRHSLQWSQDRNGRLPRVAPRAGDSGHRV